MRVFSVRTCADRETLFRLCCNKTVKFPENFHFLEMYYRDPSDEVLFPLIMDYVQFLGQDCTIYDLRRLICMHMIVAVNVNDRRRRGLHSNENLLVEFETNFINSARAYKRCFVSKYLDMSVSEVDVKFPFFDEMAKSIFVAGIIPEHSIIEDN
nr:MAG TPA: hypothetical protein [Caudoviricetes sp.]